MRVNDRGEIIRHEPQPVPPVPQTAHPPAPPTQSTSGHDDVPLIEEALLFEIADEIAGVLLQEEMLVVMADEIIAILAEVQSFEGQLQRQGYEIIVTLRRRGNPVLKWLRRRKNTIEFRLGVLSSGERYMWLNSRRQEYNPGVIRAYLEN